MLQKMGFRVVVFHEVAQDAWYHTRHGTAAECDKIVLSLILQTKICEIAKIGNDYDLAVLSPAAILKAGAKVHDSAVS